MAVRYAWEVRASSELVRNGPLLCGAAMPDAEVLRMKDSRLTIIRGAAFQVQRRTYRLRD